MKFLILLVLFLGGTLNTQAQEVDYNGTIYKVRGETILKDGADVTTTLSAEQQTGVFETLSKQKALEAERKIAEKAIKKAESDQKKAEKKQKKAEKELKAREKAQSKFEDAGDDYNDAIKKYEKFKKKGKLSPNDEVKWLEKIEDLKEDIDKAKRKL